jgi:hypothetical protein
VYSPLPLIVPQVAPLHPAPDTLQLTSVFDSAVTIPLNP